jgi:hypothetical protein
MGGLLYIPFDCKISNHLSEVVENKVMKRLYYGENWTWYSEN